MLKFKQYFCKHNLIKVADHPFVQQGLWKCEECGVFYIRHYGVGIGYFHKTPHLEDWVWKDKR